GSNLNLVFFFQAEDGIRDRNVTGVQTCALPIFTDDLWNIPEPRRFMSANSYKKDIIEPFIKKLKTVIKRIINDYLRLRHEVKEQSGRASCRERVYRYGVGD